MNLKSLGFLLAMAMVLAAAVACQDRDSTQQDDADPNTSQAQSEDRSKESSSATAPDRDTEGLRDRIAYLGSDGNIYTIRPDGTDVHKLTDTDTRVGTSGPILAQPSERRARYEWPTWSPDGTKLAVSRVMEGGGPPSYSLEVLDALTGRATRIFDNGPNTVSVAFGNSHYTQWSPDSNHLAFLASTETSVAMYVATPETRSEPEFLLEGMPLYFSWAEPHSSLLIHIGSELFLTSPGDERPKLPHPLGNVGLSFRAPAISRDAQKMVYATQGQGVSGFHIEDTQLQLPKSEPVRLAGTLLAFMWSPTREEMAVADNLVLGGSQFQMLSILDGQGVEIGAPVFEPVFAFFWSPDGEKITYVSYIQEQGVFTWNYLDRSSGETVKLVEFWPSPEFTNLLAFFDQYAYSNSVWSPDSARVLFSGVLDPNTIRKTGNQPPDNQLFVLDVEEGAVPRPIATSVFGTWSWR